MERENNKINVGTWGARYFLLLHPPWGQYGAALERVVKLLVALFFEAMRSGSRHAETTSACQSLLNVMDPMLWQRAAASIFAAADNGDSSSYPPSWYCCAHDTAINERSILFNRRRLEPPPHSLDFPDLLGISNILLSPKQRDTCIKSRQF